MSLDLLTGELRQGETEAPWFHVALRRGGAATSATAWLAIPRKFCSALAPTQNLSGRDERANARPGLWTPKS